VVIFTADFSTEAYNKRVQEVLDALYDERKDMGEEEPGYEWEGYDGWYNNPAHPDWGGAGTYADSRVFVNWAEHSLCYSRYAVGEEDARGLPRRRVRDRWTGQT
jgi:hypothetical protein